jgi:hypothetical protein
MIRNGRRDWRIVGCAALLGASVAFPIGLLLGGRESPREDARPSTRPGRPSIEIQASRNPYSPRVAGDPYVVGRQRKVLRALEESCRQLKRYCAEAEQARLRIGEAEAEAEAGR